MAIKFICRYFLFSFADVAISTIASFNRMKQITDDVNLVVKAMKMSPLLEVCYNIQKSLLLKKISAQTCFLVSIFRSVKMRHW